MGFPSPANFRCSAKWNNSKKMNDTLTLEAAGLALRGEKPIECVLAFLASRSRSSARELSEPASNVFKGVATVLDQILITVIEKRTVEEFQTAFNEVFPKYAALTLSLSRLAQTIVPGETIDRMTRESICELESDFREKALQAFGAAARDQAMFTIWTLRKINEMLTRIAGAPLAPEKAQEEDQEFCLQFTVHSLRGHFSLDCLNMALRQNRPIYPEVMTELIDGLRSMVNAYAWARRGVDLRIPPVDAPIETMVSDDEEDLFLQASTHDFMTAGEDD
jgi:hypothetical protein